MSFREDDASRLASNLPLLSSFFISRLSGMLSRRYFYNRRTREARWTLPPSTVYVRDDGRGPPGYRIFCLRTPSSERKNAARASPAPFLGRRGVGVAGSGGRSAKKHEGLLESKADRERGSRQVTEASLKLLSRAEPKEERPSSCRVEPSRGDGDGDVRGRVKDSDARETKLEVLRYAASRGTPSVTLSARSAGKSLGNPRRFLGGAPRAFEEEEEMKLSPLSVEEGSDTASSRADTTVTAAAALLRRLVVEGSTAARHGDRCLRGMQPVKQNAGSMDQQACPRARKDVAERVVAQGSARREGSGKVATDCPVLLPHRRVRAREEGPYFRRASVHVDPVLEGVGRRTRGDAGGQGRCIPAAGGSSSLSFCSASQAPRWELRAVSNGERTTQMNGMAAGDTGAGERDGVLRRARELISMVGRDGGSAPSRNDDFRRLLGEDTVVPGRNRGTNGMVQVVGDDVVVTSDDGGSGDVGGSADIGVTRRKLERSGVPETVRSGSESADPPERNSGRPGCGTMCVDASKMAALRAAARPLSR